MYTVAEQGSYQSTESLAEGKTNSWDGVELPPPAPPVPEELEDFREAQSAPESRNPISVIKDKLNPLRERRQEVFELPPADAADSEEEFPENKVPQGGFSDFEETGPLFEEEPEITPDFIDGGEEISESVESLDLQDDLPLPADQESFDLEELNEIEGEQLPNIDEQLLEIEEGAEEGDVGRFPLPSSEPEQTEGNGEQDSPLPVPTPSLTPDSSLTPVPSEDGLIRPNLDPFARGNDERPPQLLRSPQLQRGARAATKAGFVPVKHEKQAAFSVPRIALCRSVYSYEDFDEINRGALHAGQDVLIYNTLRNFTSEETTSGYRTLTRSTVEVIARGGRVVHRQMLDMAPDSSVTKRRDYFLSHQFTIPPELSEGFYILRLSVEDVLGQQRATAKMAVRVR